MSSTNRKIAFKLELSRMLALLADQIYQSPLALLRENTQNAFDAIRMRQAIPNQNFDPAIQVSVDDRQVTVSDNGIGMTCGRDRNEFLVCGKERQEHEGRPSSWSCGYIRHRGNGQFRRR